MQPGQCSAARTTPNENQPHRVTRHVPDWPATYVRLPGVSRTWSRFGQKRGHADLTSTAVHHAPDALSSHRRDDSVLEVPGAASHQ